MDSTVASLENDDSTSNLGTDSGISSPKSTLRNFTPRKLDLVFSNKFVQTELLEECDKCENLKALNASLIVKNREQKQMIRDLTLVNLELHRQQFNFGNRK